MMPSALINSIFLGAFLPLDSLLSTQGIMVMLLAAYALAMWMFLTSAPKVHTVMVTDLDVARQFYEGVLNLPVADVPLHYYYNYEQALGSTTVDPFSLAGNSAVTGMRSPMAETAADGLWYQLKKNTQLHIVGGATVGYKERHRHVCFDRDCLQQILLRVESRRLKYKVRREKPLNFLVKDAAERVIEMTEAKG
jgi:catechol 2,3-dioxygenase-like lactoylglutathione lyase family enzyme